MFVVKRLALGYMTQRVSYGGVSEQELSTGSSVMNDFRRDFQNPCSSYSLRQLVSHAGVSASITDDDQREDARSYHHTASPLELDPPICLRDSTSTSSSHTPSLPGSG